MGAQAAPVFIYRDPVEVAQSLAARDASTMLHGLRYWLRNQLDSELATRGRLHSFVLFDELLDDWRKVMCRIELDHGIRFPKQDDAGHAEVDAFLEPRLRHQRRIAPGVMRAGALTDWVQAAFAQFSVLRANPADRAAMQELDRIRAAFDRYTGDALQTNPILKDAAL